MNKRGLRRIAVALTGASGAVYGRRLLMELLRDESVEVHLMISPSAKKVLKIEDGLDVDLERFKAASLGLARADRLVYHRYDNVAAPPSSGSFRIEALAI